MRITRKQTYSALAGIGIMFGAAGLASAATGGGATSTDQTVPSAVELDEGVNCEDGIDTATGNECDGGPAAAAADEATESPDAENEADEADEIDEADEADEIDEADEADDGDQVEFEDDSNEADDD